MRENLIKKYKHNQRLAEGKFSEIDFNKNYGSGGRMDMGEMSPERKQLIISDAKERIKELESKFPFLTGKEEVKEEVKEVNVLEVLKENKKSKK
jgi:hypothetical protein